MFVQLITGRASDAEGLQRQTQRWATDVRPGAIGHLGGTFGIADDGRFVIGWTEVASRIDLSIGYQVFEADGDAVTP